VRSEPKEIDLNVYVTPLAERPREPLHEPVYHVPYGAPQPVWNPEIGTWSAE
jgi:hypothetical protein